ncbi:vacuolar protein sorting-associated protein 13B-like [Notothenia coriiceps]|uniref:Vacuolar protein sorting-associated protein 13B-like n=1 Tax=Notothenia coriiceps TaxID=8208 RepID=A0A6I9Q1Y7_9TELE|nr:PREDICTED: vacuolar protein sorting-associated protein 13B-like [Notothenia coriiceps]
MVQCYCCPAPELVLRKVINFADCTLCLDKRNASGKIDFYQDPLLYKCSFRTRLHFTYENINSKIPSVIKIHTMVESLKLSITDQQLPMFIRILELIIALYYGEIGGHKEGEEEEGNVKVREAGNILPGMDELTVLARRSMSDREYGQSAQHRLAPSHQFGG